MSFEQPPSPEEWSSFYATWGGLWEKTAIAETAVQTGLLQPGEPEKIANASREFGKRKRGLVALPWCEAIASPGKI